MKIVLFQGLRPIGKTPWGAMFRSIPEVRDMVDKAQKVIDAKGIELEGRPFNLVQYCLEGPPKLNYHTLTVYEQVLIFLCSLAILKKMNIQADAFMGMSFGEWIAAVAAGCLDFETGLLAVIKRGELTSQAGGSSLLLIAEPNLRIGKIRGFCKMAGGIWLTGISSPCQGIISGRIRNLEGLTIALRKHFPELRVVWPFDIGGAFHSPLMKKARRRFKTYLEGVDFQNPQTPIICNATGETEVDPPRIKRLLLRQIAAQLDLRKTARKLPEKAELIEVCLPPGSSPVITRLLQATLNFEASKARNRLAPAPSHVLAR